MKKIITSMAVATLIVLFITACKKTDTQQPAQTTLQKNTSEMASANLL
jgi:hypothetical protein